MYFLCSFHYIWQPFLPFLQGFPVWLTYNILSMKEFPSSSCHWLPSLPEVFLHAVCSFRRIKLLCVGYCIFSNLFLAEDRSWHASCSCVLHSLQQSHPHPSYHNDGLQAPVKLSGKLASQSSIHQDLPVQKMR